MKWILFLQLIINLIDMNDNKPMFPLSQYIVQGIAETVPNGTHIIQGLYTNRMDQNINLITKPMNFLGEF